LSGPNTGTLSNAVEFALGVCGANQAGTPAVPVVPSGFTSAFGETSNVSLQAAFQITSTTSAINPSWSSPDSVSMAAVVTTYSAAVVNTAPSKFPAFGIGAIAPLAWVINRRQIRAKERAR
jgi:hypothetical protein